MLKHTNMLENDANLFCFLASIVQNNVRDRVSKEEARFHTGSFKKNKKTKKDTHNATIRK